MSTTNTTSSLECTSVVLPYPILDSDNNPLVTGTYTADAGAEIKS